MSNINYIIYLIFDSIEVIKLILVISYTFISYYFDEKSCVIICYDFDID